MARTQRYLLPLGTIIDLMKPQPTMVAFRAPLEGKPLPTGMSKEPSFAEIVLGGGMIASCRIITADGRALWEQQEAMHVLHGLRELEWTLSPLSSSEPPLLPGHRAASGPAVIPQKQSLPPSVLPGVLTHRQRQVWLLLDGQRGVDDLAHLLGLSCRDVEDVLAELARLGLMTWPCP